MAETGGAASGRTDSGRVAVLGGGTMGAGIAIVAARGRGLRLAEYRTAAILGPLQMGLFAVLAHFAVLVAGPGKTSVLVFTMPFSAAFVARIESAIAL